MAVPQKKELPCDPVIPLLGICPKELKAGSWRDIGTPTFIAVLFIIAERWKQPKCPLKNEWINKMCNIHKWIIFSLKKEWKPVRWYNMDEPWEHYAKWNKPVTKGQLLYNFTYIIYLQ